MSRLRRTLKTISEFQVNGPHRVVSVPWALLPYPSESSESSSPNRAPIEDTVVPYLEPSKKNQWTTPQVPQRAPEATDARLQNFLYLSLNVSVKWPHPSMSPIRVPVEREASSPGPLVNSFIYMSGSPLSSPSTRKGKNIRSPSTNPHLDGRSSYNVVRPGSPRGSFKTLQSLPQCHSACNTITSTLARVDQSPVSQPV